ncbi:MAG: hypothetical protein PHN75_01585, partial [Syntrophales bacterium]|nr:hypothetical protein [Syntrophales bacterium]
MKKNALYLMFAIAVMAVPSVSFSQSRPEGVGKETVSRVEMTANQPVAGIQDGRQKGGQEEAKTEQRASQGKGKNTEGRREEQDQDIMEQALILLQASQDYWV